MATTMTPPRTGLTARLAADLDLAFPDLMRDHADGIYSGVRRLVPTAADAEDITQETFVRAYRALERYDSARIEAMRTRPWLWTIALNLCRNAARGRARRRTTIPLEIERHEPAATEDVSATAIEAAGSAEWGRRLAELPEPQRLAVVLRHVADLPYREISEALSRPVGTVKADVHRGIERLRRLLDEERMPS